jgi:hypothetical protein
MSNLVIDKLRASQTIHEKIEANKQMSKHDHTRSVRQQAKDKKGEEMIRKYWEQR